MIYLDHASHSPVDARVRRYLNRLFDTRLGNPHNATHQLGRDAANLIKTAQQQVAGLFGATPDSVIFTSGATEANNLAIFGLTKRSNDSPHMVTSQVEHASVLGPCERIHSTGGTVEFLPVDGCGRIQMHALEHTLAVEGVQLVSLLWVNNETGSTVDLEAIGRLVRGHGIPFHVDATQAVGRIPTEDVWSHVDSLSISSHKIGGPPGVGALLANPSLDIHAFMEGGGQQNGLRPGTIPTELVAGFGLACEIRRQNCDREFHHLAELSMILCQHLTSMGGVILSPADAAPGIVSVAFPNVEADSLLAVCDGIAASTGASCTGDRVVTSHVLDAMGVAPELAVCAIRLSLGPSTTHRDVEQAVTHLKDALGKFREGGIASDDLLQTVRE